MTGLRSPEVQRTSGTSRVLLVIGHGKTDGLCHHLLRVGCDSLEEWGVSHRVHDLLADGFDPVLRLEPGENHPSRISVHADSLVHRYQDDVRWASAYVIIHPVWWFAPPAILKGWVDRVLVHEVAIKQRANASPEGLLGRRRALLVQTFNSSRVIDKVILGGMSELFWRRIVFRSVGIRNVKRVGLYSVARLTTPELDVHRKRLREAISLLVRGVRPEPEG